MDSTVMAEWTLPLMPLIPLISPSTSPPIFPASRFYMRFHPHPNESVKGDVDPTLKVNGPASTSPDERTLLHLPPIPLISPNTVLSSFLNIRRVLH